MASSLCRVFNIRRVINRTRPYPFIPNGAEVHARKSTWLFYIVLIHFFSSSSFSVMYFAATIVNKCIHILLLFNNALHADERP